MRLGKSECSEESDLIASLRRPLSYQRPAISSSMARHTRLLFYPNSRQVWNLFRRCFRSGAATSILYYITAQRIIMENALVLPLFTVNTTYLNAPSVQNFIFDVEGYPYIYNFSLSR